MDLEDIPKYRRYEYEVLCDICSMTTKVLTQRHDSPEYETEVYVQCHCGNFLEFILQVN